MEIFVIGQTSMELYRMEFGNIGNYYIIEPMFRQLHKTFPNARIKTTLQLTDRFCKQERIDCLSRSLYYDENQNNRDIVEREIDIVKRYISSNELTESTPYISEIIKSDIIIDFSGDLWGANAKLLNSDHFFVGLSKVYIAQLLGKFTTLFASSPGPFCSDEDLIFAKRVFQGYNFVANREPISIEVLSASDFEVSNVKSYACPAFLFEGRNVPDSLVKRFMKPGNKTKVGFILSGFNFTNGPHNMWPRLDYDYRNFVELIEYIIRIKSCEVYLMSHSNGFKLPSTPFKQIPGSDYKHAQKLFSMLSNHKANSGVCLINQIMDPWTTKGFIKQFDMLISGRIHGAVAGFSQSIPTAVIDYGHEPYAHKIAGFLKVVEADHCLLNPGNPEQMLNRVSYFLDNLENEKMRLEERINHVKELAEDSFRDLKNIYVRFCHANTFKIFT
jgi:colanic acid/amylovoran biosynthesis protein